MLVIHFTKTYLGVCTFLGTSHLNQLYQIYFQSFQAYILTVFSMFQAIAKDECSMSSMFTLWPGNVAVKVK